MNETNESILMEMRQARGDHETEDYVLWACDASKRYEKGYDAGMRRGKVLEGRGGWRKFIHAMSGMNLDELRDRAEDRRLWRKLTMTVAMTHRVHSKR